MTSRLATASPPPMVVTSAPKRSSTSITVHMVAANRSHSTLLTGRAHSPHLAKPYATLPAQRVPARLLAAPTGLSRPCTAYIPHLQHPSPYSTSRRAFGSIASAREMGAGAALYGCRTHEVRVWEIVQQVASGQPRRLPPPLAPGIAWKRYGNEAHAAKKRTYCP